MSGRPGRPTASIACVPVTPTAGPPASAGAGARPSASNLAAVHGAVSATMHASATADASTAQRPWRLRMLDTVGFKGERLRKQQKLGGHLEAMVDSVILSFDSCCELCREGPILAVCRL